MSTCPSREELEQLLAEQLSGPAREAVEVHVEGCAACQKALEALSASSGDRPGLSRPERRPSPAGPRSGFLRLLEEATPDPLAREGTELAQGSGLNGASHGERPGELTMPAELSEAAAFEIIPQVPGYEVLGELGRGGMGVVYKARQIGLERIVALKMILAGAQASPRELARFRAEAEAVARLQHPNIVQIHEVGEYRGCPYFSLEFVDGGSLDQILHGQALAPHSAAKVVQSLARAVHYAHQHGIIHRDLKPGNILLKRPEVGGCGPYQCQLRGECTPKITDFGLAKRLDATTLRSHRDAIAGTPKCFRKRFLTSGLQPEVL